MALTVLQDKLVKLERAKQYVLIIQFGRYQVVVTVARGQYNSVQITKGVLHVDVELLEHVLPQQQ